MLDVLEHGRALRARLPGRPARNPDEAAASDAIHRRERNLRELFLAAHVEEAAPGRLTAERSRFLRVEQLVRHAATLVPGLTPDEQALAAESALPLKEKDGLEIDHGILLAHVLAHPETGRHLCRASVLPRPEALDLLPRISGDQPIDLGAACVSRAGKASIVDITKSAGSQRAR